MRGAWGKSIARSSLKPTREAKQNWPAAANAHLGYIGKGKGHGSIGGLNLVLRHLRMWHVKVTHGSATIGNRRAA